MEEQKIIIAYDDEGNQIMIESEGAPIEIYYDSKPVTLETAPQGIAGKIEKALDEFAKGGNEYQSGYEWYIPDEDCRLEIMRKAVYLGRVSVIEPDGMRYSEVVLFGGKMFRYDYKYACVQLVYELTEAEEAENEEWMEKYHRPLYEVEAGMIVADSVGLSRENWDDLESREEYLSEWVSEIDEIFADALKEFI